MDNIIEDLIGKLDAIRIRIDLSDESSVSEYIKRNNCNLTMLQLLINDLSAKSEEIILDGEKVNEHIRIEETDIEISKKLFPYYWSLISQDVESEDES